MRRLIANEEVTLNGMAGDPHLWPNHQTPDYVAEGSAALAGEAELLFGRVTYELMHAAWANQSPPTPISEVMTRARKYVVSGTQTLPAWNNTALLSGDPRRRVHDLKASAGPDLVLLGSLTLLRGLLDAGLVDELHLSVHPLLRGEGPALPLSRTLDAFTLTSHRVYDGGMARVVLTRRTSA
ncbi:MULTISPECIES: dihydrofolate reductase family protein [Deinococcus]|uniref:Dihydrofolate reductase family protein n=1 Tax=Deinococcus rufus TaxID=2136097 RepID=A0ABV7Z3V7_9DEIO|nr:dihydrofolate reductase family protein [Deinococcus sp. AB2017081]WQE95475.1 dihydrofolate reductase family protein [Deinococcus sp. AB2017081]